MPRRSRAPSDVLSDVRLVFGSKMRCRGVDNSLQVCVPALVPRCKILVEDKARRKCGLVDYFQKVEAVTASFIVDPGLALSSISFKYELNARAWLDECGQGSLHWLHNHVTNTSR